jgi:hypothetical protein
MGQGSSTPGVGIKSAESDSTGLLTFKLTDDSTTTVQLPPGKSGVSVTTATINSAGNLILTLSDSTTIDVGKVKGEKGDPGVPGKDGAPGAPGAPGAAGGPQGIPGNGILSVTSDDTAITVKTTDGKSYVVAIPRGVTGTSVAKAEITTEGILKFTMTDGSTVSAGKVKGDKGDPGAPGKDGINGTNGTNGTNGANGAPGAPAVTPGLNFKDGLIGINTATPTYPLELGGFWGTQKYLKVARNDDTGSWANGSHYDAARYISTGDSKVPAENEKQVNIGPGGVGIGYAPPQWGRQGIDALVAKGNVGINTDAPEHALHVKGNTAISGKIIVGEDTQEKGHWTGINIRNEDGRWTHFNHKEGGAENHIRGRTYVDGTLCIGETCLDSFEGGLVIRKKGETDGLKRVFVQQNGGTKNI